MPSPSESLSSDLKPDSILFPSDSWKANCAANDQTNGVDRKQMPAGSRPLSVRAKAMSLDLTHRRAIGLPSQYQPTLPPVTGGASGVIKSYILPQRSTGVVSLASIAFQQTSDFDLQLFIGSFEGDFDQFMADTVAAVNTFKDAAVTHLLIDLTNNGGQAAFVLESGTISLISFVMKVVSSAWQASCSRTLPGRNLVTRKLLHAVFIKPH